METASLDLFMLLEAFLLNLSLDFLVFQVQNIDDVLQRGTVLSGKTFKIEISYDKNKNNKYSTYRARHQDTKSVDDVPKI